ncbi:hypothetical protein BKA64DRAFT_677305 [Cadophora sp. MPI-SDFR-AT-0126]|nr:hypothetical protein BKA64DRAFT_677305 [Leotiomycetes sp. MPI-SDFR-AT-0126]
MSLTRSQVSRQISICLLILWHTATVVHISLYPYLLSDLPSNVGDVILLWKIAPVIWWTAFIWLCDITRPLYSDIVCVFLVGVCVGTASRNSRCCFLRRRGEVRSRGMGSWGFVDSDICPDDNG